jgi:N-acetylmuramoyl-L-alanine amidase
MSVANKYEIERRYISKGRSRSGEKLIGGTPDFLVAHETANNTADADDHFRYFNRHVVSASAHTFIDDRKILEIIPVDEKAHHVVYNTPIDNRLFGDDANDKAIGTELCRTGEFDKAYDQYVWYHAYLCRKFGLNPSKDIVAHKVLDPNRRSDPQSWLAPHGVSWEDFIQDVQAYFDDWYGEAITVKPPAPKVKSLIVSNPEKVLRKGDKGSAVKELQQRLIIAGFSLPKYGADGDYGDETVAAVKGFQKTVGISADGIYGPVTDKKLDQYKKPSGIPVKGTIKIVNVNSAAFVMNAPDRIKAKNIGTLKKGTKIDISGSVKGRNNHDGYWEVIYKGRRAYISGQFGKLV